jgi:hypothetical protein
VTALTNDPAILRTMDDDPVAAVLKAKVPLLFLYGVPIHGFPSPTPCSGCRS